jgi:hypothetical protein
MSTRRGSCYGRLFGRIPYPLRGGEKKTPPDLEGWYEPAMRGAPAA